MEISVPLAKQKKAIAKRAALRRSHIGLNPRWSKIFYEWLGQRH